MVRSNAQSDSAVPNDDQDPAFVAPETKSFNLVFIEVSDDNGRARPSARRLIRSNAAKVSAHLSSATKARNTRRQKATNRTELPSSRTTSDISNIIPIPSEQNENTTCRSDSSSPLSILEYTGLSKDVPATQTEIFYLPCMPVVVDNYLRRLATAFPEIDGPNQTGLLSKVWFPLVLHSPAVFQVTMLFSATHFSHYFPDDIQHDTLLHLKQCALTSLGKLVQSRTVNDEAIAAVVKMASFEALFGTSESFHVHMHAVQTMLTLRGGIVKLGLDGFLARLLMFIDTNSAHVLNTHLYLEGSMLPRREPLQFLNVSRFRGE